MAITTSQHPVFREFHARAEADGAGYYVNFLGQKADIAFGIEEGASAEPPPVDEESFEWIAMLEAVLEARETFTMFELGAGFGRWLVAAVCAARQKHPGMRFELVGVEPEPTHFTWMKQHFVDNGLNPREHTLLEAVVNGTGEPAHFVIGYPREWYGQAIVPEGYREAAHPHAGTIRLPAVRLIDLLKSHRYVDLIDMDIQGAEEEVVSSSIGAMSEKARRAYVSTHSAQIHEAVAHHFQDAGWKLATAHGWTGAEEETVFGPVTFGDGIQYWLNPHVKR
ncbi:MAG TPA: FkbM family methyltransferase [Candidatus Acidoferrales bacterium]|nr:FkbM family methyltransferase [Candidatus Acidoferrales bacterium]